jgi:hypothetical protein
MRAGDVPLGSGKLAKTATFAAGLGFSDDFD